MYKIITSLLLFFVLHTTFAQNSGTIQSNGQNYIIHMVELGDNLFKLSKNYNVSVNEIWKSNPSLIDSTILPGQILRIPKTIVSKVADSKTKPVLYNVDKSIKYKNPKLNKIDSSKIVYHLVEQGQTLYAIARMYDKPIENLVKWNNLPDNNIKIGSKLIVNLFGAIKVVDNDKNNDKNEVVIKEIKPSSVAVKTTIKPNSTQDGLYQNFNIKENKKQKIQRGTGAPMATSTPNNEVTYFALHKNAATGTIIKIKNLVNNKSVFAKVLSKLPEIDENKNVIIRYSETIKKELNLMEGKNYVEIEYYE